MREPRNKIKYRQYKTGLEAARFPTLCACLSASKDPPHLSLGSSAEQKGSLHQCFSPPHLQAVLSVCAFVKRQAKPWFGRCLSQERLHALLPSGVGGGRKPTLTASWLSTPPTTAQTGAISEKQLWITAKKEKSGRGTKLVACRKEYLSRHLNSSCTGCADEAAPHQLGEVFR